MKLDEIQKNGMKLHQTLWAAIDEEGNIAVTSDGQILSSDRQKVEDQLNFWLTIHHEYFSMFKIAQVKIIHI
jgi:hypothetical protein